MMNFSYVQRLQRFVVLLQLLHCLIIRQFMEYLTFDSLSCQMYLLSSVAFLYLLNLNELVWQ